MDRRMTGTGFHEILIEHPDHNRYLYDQTKEETRLVLSALQRRYIQIGMDERISPIVMFRNHSAGAGSSLDHPHCQILATPVMPNDVRRRTLDAQQFFNENGCCLFCKMIVETRPAEDSLRPGRSRFQLRRPKPSREIRRHSQLPLVHVFHSTRRTTCRLRTRVRNVHQCVYP
jgi:galactose-1-phosphate uridylyltransferase-like protein